MTVLFVVGPPGVGKTTLVRGLLGPDMYGSMYCTMKPKWTIGEHVCAAGHYTGETFDGADMVPYNGAKDALVYWSQNLKGKALTIFDGDRFSNANSLEFLRQHESKIMGVHLSAPSEVLTARREERGSKQNDSWMRGRATKAENFSKLLDPCLRLDASRPALELLEALKVFLA